MENDYIKENINFNMQVSCALDDINDPHWHTILHTSEADDTKVGVKFSKWVYNFEREMT